ncbi:DUF2905 domain-containing protein [Virgibacillus sp. 179-BFC.A HS]|uniref:DUF2905 domain-containing protein n=1 Tax=Tigheibacillus jepli TaxID=3035914 RepID=A0ABU5CGL2_9BACI|nr:DUF2905 domain-containing protein [Virgibacillus sp. 179-BFC.A HS]MDY0405469.1 DUF2905 domain-containing protein [Virgibacillus sp. 179-BFC.A HS]
MYKMFIVLGAVLLLVGLIGTLFGKLPGDIRFSKGNVTFYFPIMTSIIISILLSFVFYLINKFR